MNNCWKIWCVQLEWNNIRLLKDITSIIYGLFGCMRGFSRHDPKPPLLIPTLLRIDTYTSAEVQRYVYTEEKSTWLDARGKCMLAKYVSLFMSRVWFLCRNKYFFKNRSAHRVRCQQDARTSSINNDYLFYICPDRVKHLNKLNKKKITQ